MQVVDCVCDEGDENEEDEDDEEDDDVALHVGGICGFARSNWLGLGWWIGELVNEALGIEWCCEIVRREMCG